MKHCPESMDIIVIEDDMTLQKMLVDTVRELGHGMACVHGREDVDAARAILEGDFDIHGILLDGGGVEIDVIRKIRQCPIVVYTGREEARRELGDEWVFIKPMQTIDAVRRLLQVSSEYYWQREIPDDIGECLTKAGQVLKFGYTDD